jgi:hypothetical protein
VRVTLVHGSDRLLPSLPASLGAAARAWLEGKGCKVCALMRVGQAWAVECVLWLCHIAFHALHHRLTACVLCNSSSRARRCC